MRKLASIQAIRSLETIEGADAIEKATVLGWQVVVKKDEFKVGDLCVYIEIDSILPEKPEFEFLKPRKMRIKTILLRGQISQGICFPLNILPPGFDAREDADCTESLGIKKYEPPIPPHLAGIMKGGFPSFIPKTDETRVQVLQAVLDKYKGETCYVTEKLDGSSVTYYFNNDLFGVCSRNLELLDSEENTLWKLARENRIENKLRSLGRNIALQGEICGEGINKNSLRMRGQKVFFYNIYDIDKREYLSFEPLKALLNELGFEMVPLIDAGYTLINDVNALVEFSKRKSLINKDGMAEGIVIRPLTEKTDFEVSDGLPNGRVSFKVVNLEYLLKYEE